MTNPIRISLLAIAGVLISLLPGPHTARAFTQEQIQLLNIAAHEGQMVGYPETVQAILLVESQAGTFHKGPFGIVGDKNLGFGLKSYGVTQVRLETALFVIRHNPDVAKAYTPEEVMVGLITSPRFCLRISALYLRWLIDHTQHWSSAVAAYNAGIHNIPGGKPYYEHVRAALKTVRLLRKTHPVPK